MLLRIAFPFLVLTVLAGVLAVGAGAAPPSLRELSDDHAAYLGQSGEDATLRPIGDSSRYRLALHDVGRRSTYYRDRERSGPHRVEVGTAKALRLFKAGSRLAAIEVPGAPASHDALAAMVRDPTYDPGSGTVTYVAEPLPEAPGSGESPDGLEVDPELPEALGEARIFVGGLHDSQYCEGEVFEGTTGIGDYWTKLVNQSKRSSDIWSLEPALETESADGAFWLWESRGEDGHECSNEVVLGPEEEGHKPTLTMKVTYEVGNHAHVECIPLGYGECSHRDYEHGIFDTDLTAKFTVSE